MGPVHFLHIGKTGGNALQAALKPIAEEFGLIMHGHATTLADIPVGEQVAFVVRDPVDRFVSGFNSRLRKGRPLLNSDWRGGEAEAFARFKTPNELAEALTAAEGRDQALRAMREIFHVKTTLADWLVSEAYVRERSADIAWIGRAEKLTDDFERLKQRLGLPVNIALPTDPVASHKTPEGFSTALSDTGRQNVAQWYAMDREFLARLESRGLLS